MTSTAPSLTLRQRIPSIQIFVRHSPGCTYAGDENWRRCACRKHLRWTEAGKQRRASARTRSWPQAEDAKRKLEAQFEAGAIGVPILQRTDRVTVERAIELFLADKQSQGVQSGVVKKYGRELGRLQRFLSRRAKSLPAEITMEDLTEYKGDWDSLYPSSRTRGKVQDRLKTFLRYCYEGRWIDRIPKLSPIRVVAAPTLPLSDAEYTKLVSRISFVFPERTKAKKVHAFVQLMRWSGLAIRDAVTLEREELQHDQKKKLRRVTTSRQKTGTHVSVPIPPAVAQEIMAVQNTNPKFFFWTGNGSEESAVTNWQHDLRALFRDAGLPQGHPHQLRDTFAVDLLRKGVPLEEVSKLLGHESIKTTERAYAPWVQARQDRLDVLVTATWKKGSLTGRGSPSRG